jgi:hypothetical protein
VAGVAVNDTAPIAAPAGSDTVTVPSVAQLSIRLSHPKVALSLQPAPDFEKLLAKLQLPMLAICIEAYMLACQTSMAGHAAHPAACFLPPAVKQMPCDPSQLLSLLVTDYSAACNDLSCSVCGA